MQRYCWERLIDLVAFYFRMGLHLEERWFLSQHEALLYIYSLYIKLSCVIFVSSVIGHLSFKVNYIYLIYRVWKQNHSQMKAETTVWDDMFAKHEQNCSYIAELQVWVLKCAWRGTFKNENACVNFRIYLIKND